MGILFLLSLTIALADANGDASHIPGQNAWVQVVEHAEFSPRDTAEGVVFDDGLWLSNGYFHGNVLHRDLWKSRDGIVWTQILEATPYDGYSEMVVYKNQLWAVKKSVWNSTDGIAWTEVLDETPFGTRGYGELVVHKDAMWQLGSGVDVWQSKDGVNWQCANAAAPFGKRMSAAVVAHKGKLWLMGGAVEQESDPPEKHYPQYTTLNDVWCSEDGATWERVLEHAPWPPRMWSVAAVYKGRIWLIGGFSNRESANLGDVWYSEDGEAWHEFVARPAFAPRHEPTPYVFRDSLWVVAGNCWPLVNDVWNLTLTRDALKP